MDERLLQLYNTELQHLRETAVEFGRARPKIAGRLALGDEKEICQDPYVERLLEGFAFLAARVHLKLDSEFPRFTQGLLETVYPDYLAPVPSMCIVRCEPDEREPALAAGFAIPRGTLLRSQLAKNERTPCTFRTAQEVRLLPLKVSDARYFIRDLAELNLPRDVQARAAVRLRLTKTIANPFKEIQADPLTFFIRGTEGLAGQIYEQIIGHAVGVVVQSPKGAGRKFRLYPKQCVRRVGFAPDQSLLPPAPNGFEGYRLLREYFAFPERFLFFALQGFQDALTHLSGEDLDLVILLDDQDPRLEGKVNASSFELYCTAAINLFEMELPTRIQVSNRFSEFHVVADRNRPLDFEIYRVTGVNGYKAGASRGSVFRPFYRTPDTDLEASAFYTVHRTPRLPTDRERQEGQRSSYAGTDVYLSIVDADMAPYHPDVIELGVRAFCTNRHLPIQMARGVGRTDFTMDGAAPLTAIRVVLGPTVPRPSIVLAGQDPDRPLAPSGRFAWRLISHLSLNYLSLVDKNPKAGAEGLREMLRLYADPSDRQAEKEIREGLRSVHSMPIIRRVRTPGPITFARGLEITLHFDETQFAGHGVFVLGAVMEQFLAKYVALNSFTETVVSTEQRKEIMRWPAQMGTRQII